MPFVPGVVVGRIEDVEGAFAREFLPAQGHVPPAVSVTLPFAQGVERGSVGNGVEPRVKRAVPAEVVDVPEELDKGVLHGVCRVFVVSEHASQVPVQRGLPGTKHVPEGTLT